MATPHDTVVLSGAQVRLLAEHGEERQGAVGDVLWRVGDREFPFVVILEGEAAMVDPLGQEIVRMGSGGFLGEVGLMSGETAFLSAVITEPSRHLVLDRLVLRRLLFEHESLSDLLLGAFVERRERLQRRAGLGPEVIGPRDSEPTRRLIHYLRDSRFVFHARDPEADADAAALIAGLSPEELPLVRLPGEPDMIGPTPGQVSRALGVGLELAPLEEVDLLIVGAGPAGLGAAVYGASEGLDTLMIEARALGGQAGTSRRIENYLGFPAGLSGNELVSRAITQARKFGTRSATPYRAEALRPGAGEGGRHLVELEGGTVVAAKAVVLATGAQYRRLPVAGIEDYEGFSIFYAAGPLEAQSCGAERVAVAGGGNSAGQAAVWLARGGALVTLLHRRADLAETMSAYLLEELDAHGVRVRGASEIAELSGTDGRLEGVRLTDGTEHAVSFLFCFLGASPCTDWLGDTVARDDHGFVLTGESAGVANLLSTSVPGVYAAGDVRSDSIKRCATAVGDGAMVVRFVHEHLTGVPA